VGVNDKQKEECMKNVHKNVGIVLLTILIGFLAMSCNSAINSPVTKPTDGKGIVQVNLGGAARTIMPSNMDLTSLYYELEFSQTAGGEEHETIPRTPWESGLIEMELAVGTWDLIIRGYVSSEEFAPEVVYYDQLGITINSGEPTQIYASLLLNESNMTQNGSGTLEYDFTLPSGNSGALLIQTVDGEDTIEERALGEGQTTGEFDLPSGEYLIYAPISSDGGAPEQEYYKIAHIYDSAITKAIASPDDFTDVYVRPDLDSGMNITLSMDDFDMTDQGDGAYTDGPIIWNKSIDSSINIVANMMGLSWSIGNTQLGTGNAITIHDYEFPYEGYYTISFIFVSNGKTWQSEIPFTVTDNSGPDILNGTTWTGSQQGVDFTITFNDFIFQETITGFINAEFTGTYSISGDTLFVTITSISGPDADNENFPAIGDSFEGTISGDIITIESQGVTLTKQTGSSTPGTLTIIGLEGKTGYVTASSGVGLYANASNDKDNMGIAGEIINNQVVLKVWKDIDGTDEYEAYNGNDQDVAFQVAFYENAALENQFSVGKVTVDFSNGIGSSVFEEITTPSDTGTLTITGLPGPGYVFAQSTSNPILVAAEDIDFESMIINGGAISNGEVILNVWQMNSSNMALEAYTGNDQNVMFSVSIFDQANMYGEDTQSIGTGYVTVNFTDGIGSAVFVDQYEVPSDTGTLAITGLPESGYVIAQASDIEGRISLLAAANINHVEEDVIITGGTISNSSVTLKVWDILSGSFVLAYSGDDQDVSFAVGIFDNATSNGNTPISQGTVTVNFTDGVGSAVFVEENL
jgi:hypothetical protein